MRKGILSITAVSVIFLLTLAVPFTASAQQQQQYQPSMGQEGKDVIWVPTPEELIASMLDMAKLTPKDFVMDLGSGDGRIVIAAAKRGARGLGIEYNPDMVELSKQSAQKEGVADRANFVKADIFETDFSKATVITMYLLPDLNMRLRPKILEMKPGTRVVSHAFNMEDWEADQTASVEYRTAYLWIVPAKVEGMWTWKTPAGTAELQLKQTFQKIEGTVKVGGKDFPISNAKLDGDQIIFSAGTSNPSAWEYSGHVNGSTITGTMRPSGGAAEKWLAELKK